MSHFRVLYACGCISHQCRCPGFGMEKPTTKLKEKCPLCAARDRLTPEERSVADLLRSALPCG